MKNNGYKIIFIKEGKFDLKQINVTPFHLGLIVSLIIATTCSFFFIFSDQFVEWAGSREIKKHRSNNAKLVKIIEENQIRIEDMAKQLEFIKQQDDLLRKLVKLPPIHKDVRKLGTGGKKGKDVSEDLEYLLPLEEEISLFQINEQLDMVNRIINLESLSYGELLAKGEKNKDIIKRFPAIHPINKDLAKFSSGYGYRRDPFTHKYTFHDGHDFSARTGTPVYATAEGRIKISKYYSTYGNYIEIDHGGGYVTIYGHLSNRKVKVGEKVIRGQKIGEVGNTGRSTAPHLHYEIQYRRKSIDPTNFYFDITAQ